MTTDNRPRLDDDYREAFLTDAAARRGVRCSGWLRWQVTGGIPARALRRAKPRGDSSPTRCRRSSGPATPQGRLEWVNDRWIGADRPERARSRSTDKGALVAVHPDDRDELQRALRGRARDLEPVRDRVPDPHQAGRVSLSSRARRAGPRTRTGAITRWVAAAFDMHDRRAGRGGAARVRAQVRDRLPPQSAADADHALRRRERT